MNTSSITQRMIGFALAIIVVALAVSYAVHLIESVWIAIVMIVGVGFILTGAVLVFRSRSRGW